MDLEHTRVGWGAQLYHRCDSRPCFSPAHVHAHVHAHMQNVCIHRPCGATVGVVFKNLYQITSFSCSKPSKDKRLQQLRTPGYVPKRRNGKTRTRSDNPGTCVCSSVVQTARGGNNSIVHRWMNR